MNITAIIPARGGSKGIPRKNLRKLGGKPLIAWTIEAARKSRFISRVIVSSEDKEIIETANQYGAETPFVRPAELAQDNTPALPVIKHAVRFIEEQEKQTVDYITLLQPTSPLRTTRHIDEALEKLVNSNADSIVSVIKAPHNCNPYSIMKMKGNRLVHFLPNDEQQNLRQMKPEFYARNGAAIYAFTRECLRNNSIYGKIILPYLMSRETSFDIDEFFDLELCECILRKRNEKNGAFKKSG